MQVVPAPRVLGSQALQAIQGAMTETLDDIRIMTTRLSYWKGIKLGQKICTSILLGIL